MNRRKKSLFVVVLCIMLTVCVGRTRAWGPIAHYYIAQEASKEDMPEHAEDYASLPDYRDSKYFWLVPPAGIVTEQWCWSHAVQATGYFGSGAALYPKKPSYPGDGRYPGEVMKVLVTEKLDLSNVTDATIKDLQNTINGFRAHNAADSKVHFEFFHAADPDSDLTDVSASEGGDNGESSYDQPMLAWKEHHGLKEVWADYEVLIRKRFDSKEDDAFDENGMINHEGFHIPFEGNSKLMSLAQKVYRKNRRSTKTTETHWFDGESYSEIDGALDTSDSDTIAYATYNLLQTAPWFDYWTSVAGNVYLDDEQGNQVDVSGVSSQEHEYDLLLQYKDYTAREFGDDGNPHNDWKVWNGSEIVQRYNSSVSAASDWMYTAAELTP